MFSQAKDRLYYGWVVVIILAIIGITIVGIPLSFGVFFKSIESEFNLTRAATSAISSTYMIFGCVFSILFGWVLDRYGPRIVLLLMGIFTGLSLTLTSQTTTLWQLFITYGVLLSIGISAIYVVIISTVSRWFEEKRGLALGIAGLGNGLGTVIVAPLATYLIGNLGWRLAYLVLGLIAWLIVLPLSRLVKNDPCEVGAIPDGIKSTSSHLLEKRLTDEELRTEPHRPMPKDSFRTRSFWLITTIWILFGFCTLLVFTHLVPHATDMGISAVEAATFLSLIGGATIAGKVLMGIVSDKIGRKSTAIICALLISVAVLSLIWTEELWTFYIFTLVFGFGFGGIDPSLAAIVGETFGLRNIGLILGVLDASFRIGSAIGSTVGGLIFDITGSYSVAFLIGTICMLTGSLLIALVRRETGAENPQNIGVAPQE